MQEDSVLSDSPDAPDSIRERAGRSGDERARGCQSAPEPGGETREQKERWPCDRVVIETQAAPRSTHTNDPACRITACQAAPDPSRITSRINLKMTV